MDQKQVIIYARVSTDEQAKDDKVSLDDQVNTCIKYARHNKIEGEIRVFKEDYSGFKNSRPLLNEIKELMSKKLVKAMIFKRIDRISREQAILDQLRKNYFIPLDIDVHSVEDLGRLKWDLFNIHMQNSLCNFANLWGQVAVKVMNDGKLEKIRRGSVMVHGTPPYGYILQRNEQGIFYLIIHPDEAHWVQEIYRMYIIERSGAIRIATRLNEMSIPSPSTATHRKSSVINPKWKRGSIQKILKNRVYMGEWVYGRSNPKEYKNLPVIEVPQIISKEVYDKAQEVRKRNRKNNRRQPKYQYLMRDQLTCGKCQGKVLCKCYIRQRNNKQLKYIRYVCWRHHGEKVNYCKMPIFDAALVDKIAWNWIKNIFEDTEVLKAAIMKYIENEQANIEPIKTRLESVQDSIKIYKSQLNRLLTAYESGVIELDLLAPRKKELDGMIASLQSQEIKLIDRLESRPNIDTFARLIEVAGQIKVSLENADFETQVRIINTLDVKGTLLLEGEEKKLKITCLLGESFSTISLLSPRSIA